MSARSEAATAARSSSAAPSGAQPRSGDSVRTEETGPEQMARAAEGAFHCERWAASGGTCCPAGTVRMECPALATWRRPRAPWWRRLLRAWVRVMAGLS